MAQHRGALKPQSFGYVVPAVAIGIIVALVVVALVF